METARTVKKFKNQKGVALVFFQGEFDVTNRILPFVFL